VHQYDVFGVPGHLEENSASSKILLKVPLTFLGAVQSFSSLGTSRTPGHCKFLGGYQSNREIGNLEPNNASISSASPDHVMASPGQTHVTNYICAVSSCSFLMARKQVRDAVPHRRQCSAQVSPLDYIMIGSAVLSMLLYHSLYAVRSASHRDGPPHLVTTRHTMTVP
jgi:hypothetical protein